MDFASRINQEQFQRRLAEAIAWCTFQHGLSCPAEKLRSPQLRPPEIVSNARAIFERPKSPEMAKLLAMRDTEGLRQWQAETAQLLVIEHAETERQWQQNVEQLGMKRATFLQDQDRSPLQLRLPLAGGRLLAFTPDGTLSDGAANVSSEGFFDNDNMPAWDTWIWYVTNDPVSNLEWWEGCDSYLLSWVPDALIEMVEAGIEVNPEECIRWATDLDTPFMRHLKQAGFVG